MRSFAILATLEIDLEDGYQKYLDAFSAAEGLSMIPKSGSRFSDKDMLKSKKLERVLINSTCRMRLLIIISRGADDLVRRTFAGAHQRLP